MEDTQNTETTATEEAAKDQPVDTVDTNDTDVDDSAGSGSSESVTSTVETETTSGSSPDSVTNTDVTGETDAEAVNPEAPSTTERDDNAEPEASITKTGDNYAVSLQDEDDQYKSYKEQETKDFLSRNRESLDKEVKEGKTFANDENAKAIAGEGTEPKFASSETKSESKVTGQRETEASKQARAEAEAKNKEIEERNTANKQAYDQKVNEAKSKLEQAQQEKESAEKSMRAYNEELTRPNVLPSYQDSASKSFMSEEDYNDPSMHGTLGTAKENAVGAAFETFYSKYQDTPAANALDLLTPTEMRDRGYTDTEIAYKMEEQASILLSVGKLLDDNDYSNKMKTGETALDSRDEALIQGMTESFNKSNKGGVADKVSSILDPFSSFETSKQTAASVYLATGDKEAAYSILSQDFTKDTIMSAVQIIGEATSIAGIGNIVNAVGAAKTASDAARVADIALKNAFGSSSGLHVPASEAAKEAVVEAAKQAAKEAGKNVVKTGANAGAGVTVAVVPSLVENAASETAREAPDTSPSSKEAEDNPYAQAWNEASERVESLTKELNDIPAFVEEKGVDVPNPEYEDIVEETFKTISTGDYGLTEEQRAAKSEAIDAVIDKLGLNDDAAGILKTDLNALYGDVKSDAYAIAVANIEADIQYARDMSTLNGKPTEQTLALDNLAVDALMNAQTTANQYKEASFESTEKGLPTAIQDALSSTNLKDIYNAKALEERTSSTSKTDRAYYSQNRVDDALDRMVIQTIRDSSSVGKTKETLQDMADKIYGIDKDPSQIKPGTVEQELYKQAENMNIPTKGLGNNKVETAFKAAAQYAQNLVKPATDKVSGFAHMLESGAKKAIDYLIPDAVQNSKAADWLNDRLTDVKDMALNLFSPGKVASSALHAGQDTAAFLLDLMTTPFDYLNDKVTSFKDQLDTWYGYGRAVSTGKATTYDEMEKSLQTRRVRQSAAGLGEIGFGLLEYLYNPMLGTGTVINGMLKVYGANQNMRARAVEAMDKAIDILNGIDPYETAYDVDTNDIYDTVDGDVKGAASTGGDLSSKRKKATGDLDSGLTERDASGWNNDIINSAYERNPETAQRFAESL